MVIFDIVPLRRAGILHWPAASKSNLDHKNLTTSQTFLTIFLQYFNWTKETFFQRLNHTAMFKFVRLIKFLVLFSTSKINWIVGSNLNHELPVRYMNRKTKIAKMLLILCPIRWDVPPPIQSRSGTAFPTLKKYTCQYCKQLTYSQPGYITQKKNWWQVLTLHCARGN